MKYTANKYHVSRPYERTMDGIVFDSKAEMQMYAQLKMLEKQRLVKDITLQPEFELQPKYVNAAGEKVRALKYRADFSFYGVVSKKYHVVDCKGFKTRDFLIKKKLFDFIMKDEGLCLEYSL